MRFTGPSLRDRLRTGTRTAQDALERAQRQFDLTQTPGQAAFLRAQRDSLRALRAGAPELTDVLNIACSRIADDLADLACTVPPKSYSRPKTDDETARGYVWHSQQLGLRMLSRRLPDRDAPGRRFMTAARDVAAWRQLCDEIEHLPGYGPQGDIALRTANDWLALFETIHLEHARDRP